MTTMTPCILSMSAVLAPGETRDLSVEPTVMFRPQRLIIAEVPRSKRQLVFAWLRRLPLAIVENFLALFSDYPLPGLRLDPYFPMEVVQFKVGTCEQFSASPRIPAEVFASHCLDPSLHFDLCPIGQKLTVTVQSKAKHPFTCRVGIIGSALEEIA